MGDENKYALNPLKISAHLCTAYFPGSGPNGKTCRDCTHLVMVPRDRKKWYCQKWISLSSLGAKKVLPIPPETLACKYFETGRKGT